MTVKACGPLVSSLYKCYYIIICVYWFELFSQVSDVAHGPLVFLKQANFTKLKLVQGKVLLLRCAMWPWFSFFFLRPPWKLPKEGPSKTTILRKRSKTHFSNRSRSDCCLGRTFVRETSTWWISYYWWKSQRKGTMSVWLQSEAKLQFYRNR